MLIFLKQIFINFKNNYNAMFSKKALGPVVAVSLLLVVAVVSVISFQTWFQGYSSSLFTQAESQKGDLSSGIERVLDSTLYIRSSKDNLSITKVEVNGRDCSADLELSRGINQVDLGSCISNAPKGEVSSATVFTNEGIYEHSFVSTLDILPSGFITVWDTRITNGNTSDSNQIRLPLVSSGTYNFNVSWGDGTNDTITSWNQAEVVHTYSTPGIYEVIIDGQVVGFDFTADDFNFTVESVNTSDAEKLIEIKQWGPLNLVNQNAYFMGTNNLDISARDPLNLTGITNLTAMFFSTNGSDVGENNYFRVSGTINNWDTSNIISMDAMFAGTSFNSPINNWDTSNVTTMLGMFVSSRFNQPLDNWDTSLVTDMSGMFLGSSFNQPINSWNVSNVKNMSLMFGVESQFNQPLDNWNPISVESTRQMFAFGSRFNQPIDGWNMKSNRITAEMFMYNNQFNQSINNWNVSSVEFFIAMFMNATSFNQPLSNWTTSNATDMRNMFFNAQDFNQDISSWDISNVQIIDAMFYNATSFNQNLSAWNTSSITSCFAYDAFTSSWTLPKPNITISCSGVVK